MTAGQHIYVMALALTLGIAQPCRSTVFAMVGNLAGTLLALVAWDHGLLTATGSIITMMVIDLACAAFLAFAAPAVALIFGAMVLVAAFGLVSFAPRAEIIWFITSLAYVQIGAILGGLGGGGGLRDYMRCARLGRRNLRSDLDRVATSEGAEK